MAPSLVPGDPRCTEIGFGAPHFAEIVATRPAAGWFEVYARLALRDVNDLKGVSK